MQIELSTNSGKPIGELDLPELPLVGDQVRIIQTDTSAPKVWVVMRRGWKVSPPAPGQMQKKVTGLLFVDLVN